jgi:hypothetical protein
MGLLAGRDGKISIFRVGVIAALLGVLLMGGGFGALFLDNGSYRQPLDIAPYPNAEQCGINTRSNTAREVFYCVDGVEPVTIADYYTQKLAEHNGNGDEACLRNPFEGSFPDSDRPGVVPYEFKCAFNRSGIGGGFQATVITIQPGVFNEDPARNTLGQTVVRYEQRWEP